MSPVTLTDLLSVTVKFEKEPHGHTIGTLDIPILRLNDYLNLRVKAGAVELLAVNLKLL